MPLVVGMIVLKSELVSLAITRTTAARATLSLDLVQEATLITENLAETRPTSQVQIIEGRVLKPWGSYWCNKTTLSCLKFVNHVCFTLEASYCYITIQANGRQIALKIQ